MSKMRVLSREFKLEAIRRLLAGENVSALARELKVQRNDLYVWRDRFRSGGADALRGPGRPRKAEAAVTAATGAVPTPEAPAASQLDAAHKRIAELERKIGQQQVELDFFRQALRQVKGARRPSDGSGVTGSTRSFKR
jgi:transposase